jgi:hypothetical protein
MLATEASALMGGLVIALDWVELRSGFRGLVASACTRHGRALPIAWKVVEGAKFDLSQNAVEDEFVQGLAKMVDPARTCIVADRGFRRVSFLALLDSLGFGYAIRVCEHVHVSGTSYTGLLENYGLKEGQEVDLGRVEYREDGATTTRIVMRWARGADEPWIIATNLTRKSLHKICAIYAQRMEADAEAFRGGPASTGGRELPGPQESSLRVRAPDAGVVEEVRLRRAVSGLEERGPVRADAGSPGAGVWVLYAQGRAAERRGLPPTKSSGKVRTNVRHLGLKYGSERQARTQLRQDRPGTAQTRPGNPVCHTGIGGDVRKGGDDPGLPRDKLGHHIPVGSRRRTSPPSRPGGPA